MADRTQGLTDADFEELKRKRDASIDALVNAAGGELVHQSPPRFSCYCACPDGPCQHKWDGPVIEFECAGGGGGAEVTCSRCGMGAMSHDMRAAW